MYISWHGWLYCDFFIEHCSAVSRRAVDFRRTDNEGPDAAVGGRLNTLIWTERSKKEERREETGNMPWRAKNPGESWRGEKGGNQNHHGGEYIET